MSKNTSHNKQRILDHDSDDASDNAAIATIINENKIDTSNKKTNKGNAF